MNAGRKRIGSLRSLAALLLIALCGCSLTGSRTRWTPPGISPVVAVDATTELGAAQAHFARGRAAEAACAPECIDHYYAAAATAWPYHAACPTTPGDPGGEIYRAAVRQMICSAVRFGRFNQQSGIRLCSGQLVPVSYQGFLWQSAEFHAFLPVGSYDSPRLNCRYAWPGVGVEYVVLSVDPARRPFLPASQPFAATAVLKPSGGMTGGGFALDFYDPLRTTTTDTGLPLARDITAPVAYATSQESDAWLEGFLRPESDPADEGLRMTQPFQPGKIPVVLVHGLASSPLTWSNLENDLRAQPAIMERYQLWVFRYDTGDPFLSSAALLRRQLEAIRQTYDPARVDANLSRMVVIGHSLGGLLAKLQVTYSGQEIWYAAAKQPFNSIVTDPTTRADLARAFFFAPSPDISRVVYIATPHRGSSAATRCIGRASSALVRERPEWEVRHQQLVRDNPCAFHEELARGIPTSVDLLEPSSRILEATNRLPYRAGVPLHSIIGDDRWTLSEGQTDGVVAVSSARLIGVQSEVIVNASHTEIQRRAETTREVLRILLAHAAETPQWTMPMAGTLARRAREGDATTSSLARRASVDHAQLSPLDQAQR